MLLARYGTHPDRPWTADMVGTGLCYAILTFYYDREAMAQVPRYRFEKSGIPLYDLRKDSTAGGVGPQRLADPATWAQTDNPIVMAWNLLRGIPLPGGEIYGGGEPVAALPAGVWIAAMNACDAPKAKKGGGTEPAWRAGMEAILTQEPASVLGELLKACAGTIADVGYGWKVQVGAPALPVYSFTDDDIIVSKPQDYDPFPGLEETFNAVTAQYPDPESLWESKEAPPRTNAAWEAADAFGRRTADLTLPAVPYKRQVQRLMRAWIEDERRFRRHSLTLPPDASALELLDTADWSSARNSAVAQGFYSYLYTDANVPSSGSGAVTVLRASASAGWVRQIAHPLAGGQYSRASTDGGATWTAWSRFVTLGSLLATVSQAGGVPTGGVIERGSNANGEYVRLADGTQICWTNTLTVDVNTAMGSVYSTSAVQTTTLPAAFVSTSAMAGSLTGMNSESGWGVVRPATGSTVNWRAFRATGATGQSYKLMLTGRWF